MGGRWVTYACWTGEASLAGYDTDEVLNVYRDETAARALQDDDATDNIGTVRPDHERYPDWCIGVGVAPEPEPGYAVGSDSEGMVWADHVPEEFLDLLDALEDQAKAVKPAATFAAAFDDGGPV